MKKEHIAVMLPTEKKQFEYKKYPVWRGKNDLYLPNIANQDLLIPQHLYILSDEEIKEGEHGIPECVNEAFNGNVMQYLRKDDKMVDCIVVSDGKKEYLTTKYVFTKARKVIATTDPELSFLKTKMYLDEDQEQFWADYPKISNDFVERYVKEWNKGNKIEKVKLEYEDSDSTIGDLVNKEVDILKLRSNGSVIISPVEERIYSEQDLLLAMEFGYKQCERGNNLDNAFIEFNKLK